MSHKLFLGPWGPVSLAYNFDQTSSWPLVLPRGRRIELIDHTALRARATIDLVASHGPFLRPPGRAITCSHSALCMQGASLPHCSCPLLICHPPSDSRSCSRCLSHHPGMPSTACLHAPSQMLNDHGMCCVSMHLSVLTLRSKAACPSLQDMSR